MAQLPRWQDSAGLETISNIVKKVIPTWTNGLHAVQLELVSAILDGGDVLCFTATGDGKSAAFAVPSLVLQEYNKHPEAYAAGLPTRTRPIGVVITPTKGLADNIVCFVCASKILFFMCFQVHELSKLNVSAFSYCKETLSDARKAGIRLAGEIKECVRWQVICVDPEHLRDKEWREITESPTFRTNVLFACVDEVHLINEWGISFRLAFGAIGTFLRGRFPSSISVVGLSATLEPGLPMVSVCKSLGFFEGNFKLIRGSNERPNTQFTIQFLTHGLNGDKFPDLLPYLAGGRKTIIHCRTIDQVSRVYAYIWRLQPNGINKLIRARVYHSICPSDYNKQTVGLLETDPRLQIVISTVAFSNGLNAKSLLDSLSLGFGSTLNESWQEKGRVGRDRETIGRGVIFAHRSVIKDAESYLACKPHCFCFHQDIDLYLACTSLPVQRKNRSKKKVKVPRAQDHSKALIITEKHCYIACVNTCYENPSLDPSHPDLSRLERLAAGRRLPCSLCLARWGAGPLVFPPSPLPAGFAPLPVLTAPRVIPRSSTAKKDKLKKKERATAETRLLNFGESVRQIELRSNNHKYRPRSSYFPSRILSSILDALFIIHSPSDLEHILNDSWPYYSSHGTALFNSIIQVQTSITVQRNTARELTLVKRREKRQAARAVDNDLEDVILSDTEPSEQTIDEPAEEPLDEFSSRKRQALEEITNTAKRPRAPRAAQPTVAQVLQDYGPRYRTRRSAHAEGSSVGVQGKENGGLRRSKRI